MIYITGDTHGSFQQFATDYFPQQKQMGGAASHDIQDGIPDPDAPGFEREYRFKRRIRQTFRVKGAPGGPRSCPRMRNMRRQSEI